MAVILGSKYQSKNRDNFRKITGLSEANEKIKPENMPRIFGGIGEVWFQGNSAAGQSTGDGGGSGSGENPSDGGSGSGGGGSGSGGGVSQCICVDISEAEGVIGIPCCITGQSCDTGETIKIQTNPNNEPVPPLPCEEPQPPSLDDCNNVIFGIRDAGGMRDYFFGTLSENNLQAKCEEFAYKNQGFDCPAGLELNAGTSETRSENIICNGETLSVVVSVRADYRCKTANYQQELVYGNILLSPTSEEIAAAVENWKKTATKTKQYFAKDGKFYNTCDPYGEPPSDEPITICDTDGNKYSVSTDGKITTL